MRERVTLVLLLVLSASLHTLFPVTAATLACGSVINSNTVLSADLSGCPADGLIVGTDGVTLDCQGHSISGSGATNTTGILIPDRTNVTVNNCNMKNFYNGFYLDRSRFSTLKSDTTQQDVSGFYLDNSNGSLLVSNLAVGKSFNTVDGWGFNLEFAFNNTLISNTASNYAYGFYLYSQVLGANGQFTSIPTFNTLRSNTVTTNQNELGFYVKTSGSIFEGNSACGQYTGFYLTGANSDSLTGNVICNDSQGGLLLEDSYDNTVKSNIFTGDFDAAVLFSAAGNLLYDNVFSSQVNVLQGTDNSLNFWNITKTPGKNIVGGPFFGGNYWVDYAGEDSNGDGLGDTATPFSSGGYAAVRDYLPLCTPLGCPNDLRNAFELDWADYDNNGKVTILDVASIAFAYGQSSPYWDLYLVARVGINDVAIVAYHYGQSFSQTSFLGQGQPAGHVDPVWKQFCNFLPSADRLYCQSRV